MHVELKNERHSFCLKTLNRREKTASYVSALVFYT